MRGEVGNEGVVKVLVILVVVVLALVVVMVVVVGQRRTPKTNSYTTSIHYKHQTLHKMN